MVSSCATFGERLERLLQFTSNVSSEITDLVTGGLNLLTVALLRGSSVAMIERHDGHLRADHATTALATPAL